MSAAPFAPPGGARRGFTIVELITVIGVITVLVSILIPATSMIRKSAARVTCAVNLRLLTAAALLYAKDNEEQLPYPNWGDTYDDSYQKSYGFGWLYALPHYRRVNWLPLDHPPEDGMKSGVLWPYLKDMRIYHCPLDDPAFRIRTNWITSYLMNGSQCGFGQLGTGSQLNVPGVRLARIKAPSESVMLWEALEQRYEGELNTGWVWNDASSAPSEEVMADRHSKGANISCYDGHVEWWDNGTWKHWVNQPGFGRLWCYPLSPDGH